MIKIIGAVLVILGCGGYGFMIAAAHRTEEKMLGEFIYVLELIESELQYRLTALPELCVSAATVCSGQLKRAFMLLNKELECQVSPNVEYCVRNVMEKVKLPHHTSELFALLGRSFGRFDAEGQLKGIRYVTAETKRIRTDFSQNQAVRLRSYRTLGVCAGVALVILFI